MSCASYCQGRIVVARCTEGGIIKVLKRFNKPLQTDERRAAIAAYHRLILGPLAAERQNRCSRNQGVQPTGRDSIRR